jgi:phage tail-like protein
MAEDEIYGSLFFELKLQGREGDGLFTEASGGGSENAVIEQKISTPTGGVQIRKIPGNLKYNDIVLKRGISRSDGLWKWRQEVVDGKFRDARCNGTIQMVDSEMKPVATYSFENGWPSAYTPAALNAGQDQAAVEELKITVESFKRE